MTTENTKNKKPRKYSAKPKKNLPDTGAAEEFLDSVIGTTLTEDDVIVNEKKTVIKKTEPIDNTNGVMYPENVLKDSIEEIEKKDEGCDFPGTISHDSNDCIGTYVDENLVTSLVDDSDGLLSATTTLSLPTEEEAEVSSILNRYSEKITDASHFGKIPVDDNAEPNIIYAPYEMSIMPPVDDDIKCHGNDIESSVCDSVVDNLVTDKPKIVTPIRIVNSDFGAKYD